MSADQKALSCMEEALAYVEETLAEAVTVMEEARDIIARGGMLEGADDWAPEMRMRVVRDLSRLTSRITAAVSILLLFKAFAEGQGDDIRDPTERLDALYADVMSPEPDMSLRVSEENETLSLLLKQAEDVMGRMERVRDLFHHLYSQ